MTYEEFARLIWSVTYKPGYGLTVSRNDTFATVVLALPNLADATGTALTIKLTFARAISLYDLEHQGAGFARYWLLKFIRDWEEHEMTEWLRIDGVLVGETQGHVVAR